MWGKEGGGRVGKESEVGRRGRREIMEGDGGWNKDRVGHRVKVWMEEVSHGIKGEFYRDRIAYIARN